MAVTLRIATVARSTSEVIMEIRYAQASVIGWLEFARQHALDNNADAALQDIMTAQTHAVEWANAIENEGARKYGNKRDL